MPGLYRGADHDYQRQDDYGVIDMLEGFTALFNAFAKLVVNVLPSSPFQDYLQEFSSLPYLGWLNWFRPIRTCMKIGAAWLAVIAVFYLYSIIMRWVKMIND